MRILHVINNGSTCGGAERLTAQLSAWQRSAGHQVHVLASDRPGAGDWFADSTWPVGARGTARLKQAYWNSAARAVLGDLLVRWAPDVVHLHNAGMLSAGALPLLREHPTVMTVHGPELFLPGTVLGCLPTRYFRRHDQVHGRLGGRGLAAYAVARLVTGPVTRRLLRRYVDAFIAPSRYLAGLVEASLAPARVIPNGLPAAFPALARPSDRGGPRLAMVGRLEPTKGAQVLVAAMPAILAAHPGARLTVVGSGAMDGALRDQATRLGVATAVAFAGWCSPTATAAVLAAADVAVVPSIWPEAFGLAALEALAEGCAVVATDVGGLPDLVRDGETGLLVPPGDSAALAGAVTRLLAEPGLRSRLAAAGRDLAADLTLPGYATQVLAVYHEVRHRYDSAAGVGAAWR